MVSDVEEDKKDTRNGKGRRGGGRRSYHTMLSKKDVVTHPNFAHACMGKGGSSLATAAKKKQQQISPRQSPASVGHFLALLVISVSQSPHAAKRVGPCQV